MSYDERRRTDKSILFYDAIKFYCYPQHEDKRARYYRTASKLSLDIYLHRHVYKKAFGEIPKGFQIHHKDHNIHNNNLENLECITRDAHFKEHEEKRLAWNFSKENLDNLKKGNRKANAARKNNPEYSSFCSKSMKERSKKLLDNGSFKAKTCLECGAGFKWLSLYPKKVFCSKPCKMRNWHKRQIK